MWFLFFLDKIEKSFGWAPNKNFRFHSGVSQRIHLRLNAQPSQFVTCEVYYFSYLKVNYSGFPNNWGKLFEFQKYFLFFSWSKFGVTGVTLKESEDVSISPSSLVSSVKFMSYIKNTIQNGVSFPKSIFPTAGINEEFSLKLAMLIYWNRVLSVRNAKENFLARRVF